MKINVPTETLIKNVRDRLKVVEAEEKAQDAQYAKEVAKWRREAAGRLQRLVDALTNPDVTMKQIESRYPVVVSGRYGNFEVKVPMPKKPERDRYQSALNLRRTLLALRSTTKQSYSIEPGDTLWSMLTIDGEVD